MDDIIPFNDFARVDMRVGTILSARENTKAKKPAYVLTIDFGEDIGIKQSSAQITEVYEVDELPGKQVVAVTNFAPKSVAGVKSEVLVLAAVEKSGRVIIIGPNLPAVNGARIL